MQGAAVSPPLTRGVRVRCSLAVHARAIAMALGLAIRSPFEQRLLILHVLLAPWIGLSRDRFPWDTNHMIWIGLIKIFPLFTGVIMSGR